MNYYSVAFSYYPCPTVNFPDDNEESRDASTAVFMAEDLAMKTAKEHNIEIVHGYVWPDGSLYKYIRTTLSCEEIAKLFQVEGEFNVEGKEEPVKVTICASPHLMTLKEAQTISGGASIQATLEERFELDGDTLMSLHKQRDAELDALPARIAYSEARETCEICRPGHLPCQPCSDLSSKSWKAREGYLNQHRPLEPKPN